MPERETNQKIDGNLPQTTQSLEYGCNIYMKYIYGRLEYQKDWYINLC